MIKSLSYLLMIVSVQAMLNNLFQVDKMKKLQEKFGDRPLNAVFVTPGSLEDVLPILGFTVGLKRQLPWLKVTKFMTYKPAQADSKIDYHKIDTCPLMENLMTTKLWKYMHRPPNDRPNSEELQYKSSAGLRSYVEFLAESQSIDKYVDDTVDVVFYYSLHKHCILNGLFGKRTKSLADRLLINIQPTFDSKAHLMYYNGLTGLSIWSRRLSGWKQNAENQVHYEKNLIKEQESSFSGKEKESTKSRQMVEANKLQVSDSTIYLVSQVFVTKDEFSFLSDKNVKFIGTQQLQDYPTLKLLKPDLLYSLKGGRNKNIYVGFGSLAPKNGSKFTEKVCQAILDLRRYKKDFRVVWQVNANGEKVGVPEACKDEGYIYFLTDFIPYSLIFPRVSTVVHHGGSDTTQAALFYGASQVVVPLRKDTDQKYFAAMVNRLKVGVGLNIEFQSWLLEKVMFDCYSGKFKEKVAEIGQIMLQEKQANLAQQVVTDIVYKASLKKDLKAHQIQRRLSEYPCIKFNQNFYLQSSLGYCNYVGYTITCNHEEAKTKFSFSSLGDVDFIHELPVGGLAMLTFKANGERYVWSIAENGKSQIHRYEHDYSSSVYGQNYFYMLQQQISTKIVPASQEFALQYDHCIRQNEKVFLSFPFTSKHIANVDHSGQLVHHGKRAKTKTLVGKSNDRLTEFVLEFRQ